MTGGLALFGGTGLIGRAVARAWLASGDGPCLALARKLPAPSERLPGVEYVAADVLEDDGLAVAAEMATAVYVAGPTSNYLDEPLRGVALATEGVAHFLAATSRATHRVLVGSARVYGARPSPEPLTEATPALLRSPDTRNLYDGAKLVAEALARHASSPAHPVAVARLGNVYGPSARVTATALSDFVQQARRNRRIELRGSGASTRNWIHVADAAAGILATARAGRDGEAYNVGGDDHVSTRALAERVALVCGGAEVVEAAPEAPADHLVLSLDKARRELGWAPSRRLFDELDDIIRHFPEPTA